MTTTIDVKAACEALEMDLFDLASVLRTWAADELAYAAKDARDYGHSPGGRVERAMNLVAAALAAEAQWEVENPDDGAE